LSLSEVYSNIINTAQAKESLDKLKPRSTRVIKKPSLLDQGVKLLSNRIDKSSSSKSIDNNMAEAELNNLIQQTFTQIHDMYENRPLNFVSTPPLLPFSGDGEANFSDWERKFSNLAILVGATDLSRKTALLCTYLRGAAQAFYTDLSLRVPALGNWDDWKTEFSTRFPDDQHIDIKRDQLVARIQKPGEPVLQYAADIRHLARRAQPGWTGHETNDFVKSHFVSKLLPNLRLWVRNASTKTFESAVAEAYKQEINQLSDSVAYNNEKQTNITNLMSNLSLSNNSISGDEPQQRADPYRRSYNHSDRDRPYFRSVSDSSNSNRFSKRHDDFPPKNRCCYFCGRPGHLQAQCRDRMNYLDSLKTDQTRYNGGDRFSRPRFNQNGSSNSHTQNWDQYNPNRPSRNEHMNDLRPMFSRNNRPGAMMANNSRNSPQTTRF